MSTILTEQKIQNFKAVYAPHLVDQWRERALGIFDAMKEQYFPEMSEHDYRLLYQDINTLARVISLRFCSQEIMQQMLADLMPRVYDLLGKQDYYICPLSTLRLYHPHMYVNAQHEQAFLQTEPHYDNGFGNYGISMWIPFEAVDDETGGLCDFSTKDIHDLFPAQAVNKLNFNRYLEQHAQYDPILERGTSHPSAEPGDALYHLNVLHGATKPKSKRRFSFNFRLIPAEQLLDKSPGVQELYALVNSNVDLLRAFSLAHLGDLDYAKTILQSLDLSEVSERYQLKAQSMLNGEFAVEPLSTVKLHWSKEFSWILD